MICFGIRDRGSAFARSCKRFRVAQRGCPIQKLDKFGNVQGWRYPGCLIYDPAEQVWGRYSMEREIPILPSHLWWGFYEFRDASSSGHRRAVLTNVREGRLTPCVANRQRTNGGRSDPCKIRHPATTMTRSCPRRSSRGWTSRRARRLARRAPTSPVGARWRGDQPRRVVDETSL